MVYNQNRMDYCNARGAKAIAEVIEAFWRDKGKTVRCTVMALGEGEGSYHIVRSDMVDGLPKNS